LQTTPTAYNASAWNSATDLVSIPEEDLPGGIPAWMRSNESWAVRFDKTQTEIHAQVPPDAPARYKRRHILIEAPTAAVP
jgi:hypothetical protein